MWDWELYKSKTDFFVVASMKLVEKSFNKEQEGIKVNGTKIFFRKTYCTDFLKCPDVSL